MDQQTNSRCTEINSLTAKKKNLYWLKEMFIWLTAFICLHMHRRKSDWISPSNIDHRIERGQMMIWSTGDFFLHKGMHFQVWDSFVSVSNCSMNSDYIIYIASIDPSFWYWSFLLHPGKVNFNVTLSFDPLISYWFMV